MDKEQTIIHGQRTDNNPWTKEREQKIKQWSSKHYTENYYLDLMNVFTECQFEVIFLGNIMLIIVKLVI